MEIEKISAKERAGHFLYSVASPEFNNLMDRIQDLILAHQQKWNSHSDFEIVEEIKSRLNLDGEFRSINAEIEEYFTLSRQEINWVNLAPDSEVVDYLIYRYKFHNYPRKKILSNFPIHVLIEPISSCNIRCIMCFQVDKSFTTKEHMGRISIDLFEKIVDEVAMQGGRAVTLASRGEPTLHKQFAEMLSYLRSKNILDIKINTNATKLNEAVTRAILANNVNEVVFSVDAGTKSTYEEIRVGGNFEQVVANIERFNELRANEFPRSRTVTRISGVQVSQAQNLDQMVNFWSNLVDEVTIKPALPRWDTYNNSPTNNSNACDLLWERTYVWHDGRVNPCDFDYKSFLSVGNVSNSSLTDLWNGPGYTKLRAQHTESKRKNLMPCDRCPL